MKLLGAGLYTISEAARLVREEPRKVRRWLAGYSWRYRDGRSYSGPLWHTQFENEDLPGGRVIGFRDLLELRVVRHFIAHGVDLRVIRATIEAASKDFGDAYPLSNRRFLTDGKRIFLQATAETGDTKLIDVLRKQYVMRPVINKSLYAGIDYDDNNNALRWYPEAKNKIVVLDPEVQFGTPIIVKVGVPTDTIYDAWRAEGKRSAVVARIYDITPAQVNAAVGFEQRLAA